MCSPGDGDGISPDGLRRDAGAHCRRVRQAQSAGLTPGDSIAIELRQDLVVRRELASLVLAIDEITVDDDVKDAAPPFDQLRLNVVLGFDRGRQTGGFGLIVSLNAVGNAHLHDVTSRKDHFLHNHRRESGKMAPPCLPLWPPSPNSNW